MTAPVSPFPPLANRPLGRTRPGPARIAVIVLVALVVVGGAAAAVAVTSSSGPSGFRTAKVSEQVVSQTLPGTGTIEPISQATVAFPTSGTVSKVDVALGQSVTVGATLAELDTGSMQSTLTDAKATLAAAELTLYQALNGEQITGGSGSGGGFSGGGSGGGGSGSGGSGSSGGAATTGASTSLDQATIEPVVYRSSSVANADDPAFGPPTSTGGSGGSG
ncbi:MAG TPA: biotin/lipoyl-binding protein, partial [Acidimicrobiales bacterium]